MLAFWNRGRVSSLAKMKIGSVQKTSFIDYPGKISAIVFTQGCNFACPFCHNPELVDPRLFAEPIPEKEVFAFLEKRQGQLDAVVITGGEPSIQADIIAFMARVKELGYLVKLDTNGARPDVLEEIISQGIADYIAMDIKAPLEKYSTVVRKEIDPEALVASLKTIMHAPLRYEFRTTLARSLLAPADIIAIGHMIEGAELYALQRFVPSKHVDTAFLSERSFSEEEIASCVEGLKGLVKACIVR